MIDFRKTELSDQQIVKMIKDLVEKFPKGKSGRYSKNDYSVNRVLRHSTGHWGNNIILNACSKDIEYGYHISDLKKLEYAINGNYRQCIYTIWPEINRKAITRRSNRLQDRMYIARRRFTNAAVPSIYEVSFRNLYERNWRSSWVNPVVTVVSSSDSTAALLGKTVAAGAGIAIDQSGIDVNRVEVYDKFIMSNRREGCLTNITKAISALQEDGSTIRDQIETLANFAVSLSEFNEHTGDE